MSWTETRLQMENNAAPLTRWLPSEKIMLFICRDTLKKFSLSWRCAWLCFPSPFTNSFSALYWSKTDWSSFKWRYKYLCWLMTNDGWQQTNPNIFMTLSSVRLMAQAPLDGGRASRNTEHGPRQVRPLFRANCLMTNSMNRHRKGNYQSTVLGCWLE